MQHKLSLISTAIATLLGVLAFVMVAVAPVDAAGLVASCDGPTCSACHLVDMINRLIVWVIGILIVLFGLMLAYAGFNLVTSAGNPGALTAAKDMFVNVIIGLIIILASWLIVDTIIRGLGVTDARGGPFPWSRVECWVQNQPYPGDPASNPGAPPLTSAGGQPVTPVPTCVGQACVPLSAHNVPCANQNSCTISPELAARLGAFHAQANIPGARVTEAMPPTRQHRSACHQNGTCVDYSVSGGMTPQQVVTAINAAQANGLRPVYEVQTQAQRDALVAAGAPAANIQVLGNWISAPHFSIYGY